METALTLAKDVLEAGSPADKVAAAQRLTKAWHDNPVIGTVLPRVNDSPARPNTPKLVTPSDVKRRRLGTEAGRAALLHAVAHIEFNAIDLAADMLARFAMDRRIDETERHDFCSDWISVCDDEARHFGLVTTRMAQMNMTYGDLPAHNGLWEAALATKDNFAARLAIAPMVLEARGLDVTPAMIEKLQAQKDEASAAVLRTIYEEEVRHVAIGRKWFKKVAKYSPASEVSQFHSLVRQYFKGTLKPPFNALARTKADLPPEFYEPLTVKL
jgi:uncharacterized ferritin-like protein (DUF455 family)